MPIEEMNEFEDDIKEEIQEEDVVEGDDVAAEEDTAAESSGPQEEVETEEAQSEEADKPKFTDEEKEDYSRRVKKKISKLTYERETERTKRLQAEAEIYRRGEEIAALRQRVGETNKLANDTSKQAIENKIESLKEKRKRSWDAGEMDAIPDIDAQLTEAQVRLQVGNIKAEQTYVPRPVQQAPVQQQEVQSQPRLEKSTASWLENNAWYNDPAYAREADMAFYIQEELKSEGMKIDDKLFSELDRRLRAASKRIGSMYEDDSPPPSAAPKKKQIVASQSRGNEGRPEVKQPGKITQDDLKSMKKYGLDPNKASDRKAWINRNSEF